MQIVARDLQAVKGIAGAGILLNDVALHACLDGGFDHAFPPDVTPADLGDEAMGGGRIFFLKMQDFREKKEGLTVQKTHFDLTKK